MPIQISPTSTGLSRLRLPVQHQDPLDLTAQVQAALTVLPEASLWQMLLDPGPTVELQDLVRQIPAALTVSGPALRRAGYDLVAALSDKSRGQRLYTLGVHLNQALNRTDANHLGTLNLRRWYANFYSSDRHKDDGHYLAVMAEMAACRQVRSVAACILKISTSPAQPQLHGPRTPDCRRLSMTAEEYADSAQSYQLGDPILTDRVVAALEAGWLRSKRIAGQDGEVYFVGRTFIHGSFGKVRYALNSAGKPLVAKEVRFNTRRAADTAKLAPSGHPRQLKTEHTDRNEWQNELFHLNNAGLLLGVAEYDERGIAFMPILEQDLAAMIDFKASSEDAPGHSAWRADRQTVVEAMVFSIATQLSAMHAGGYLHLDIKSDNIAIDGQGDLRLVDFGFTRSVDPETRDVSEFLGTLEYMAPEVVFLHSSTAQSEMWSLGVTIIALLSGTFLMDHSAKTGKSANLPDRRKQNSKYEMVSIINAYRRTHKIYQKLYDNSTLGGILNIRIFLASRESESFPAVGLAYKLAPLHTEWCMQNLLAPNPNERPTAANVASKLGTSGDFQQVLAHSRRILLRDLPPAPERNLTQSWLNAHRALYYR